MSATTALKQGQRRYQQQRRREAVRRVRQFERWRRHGFDRDHAPSELPSDADFRIAREAR